MSDLLWFWLLNWGVFFVLVVIATTLSSLRGARGHIVAATKQSLFWRFRLFRQSRQNDASTLLPRNNVFLIAGLLLFTIGNFIQLQPYAWDNRKILVWSYLLLTIPVVLILKHLWQRKFAYKILTCFLLAIIILSGTIDVGRLLSINPNKHMGVLITPEELMLAEAVKKFTRPEQIIVMSDKRGHVIPALTGSNILVGFTELVAPFDFNYQPIYKDVRTILNGGNNSIELIKRYRVSFVVLGPNNKVEFRGNKTFYDENFPLTYASIKYRVYSTDFCFAETCSGR